MCAKRKAPCLDLGGEGGLWEVHNPSHLEMVGDQVGEVVQDGDDDEPCKEVLEDRLLAVD